MPGDWHSFSRPYPYPVLKRNSKIIIITSHIIKNAIRYHIEGISGMIWGIK
jgi:hypothetical protein